MARVKLSLPIDILALFPENVRKSQMHNVIVFVRTFVMMAVDVDNGFIKGIVYDLKGMVMTGVKFVDDVNFRM